MRLEPRFQIPDDPKEAIKALSERLRVLEDLVQKTTVAQTKLVTAEPAKPRDGLFAYADGDNWDPGAGRGLYQYVNATWQPVSAPRPEIPVQIPQTPWAQDVDAAGYNLSNLGNLSFAAGKSITQDAWTAPTLANGWLDYGGTYNVAGYVKDKQGFVRLKGIIKSGTFADGTILFTLPAGYRPSASTVIAIIHSGGVCRLQVNTDGTIAIYGAIQNTWVSLDSTYFRP